MPTIYKPPFTVYKHIMEHKYKLGTLYLVNRTGHQRTNVILFYYLRDDNERGVGNLRSTESFDISAGSVSNYFRNVFVAFQKVIEADQQTKI